MKIAVLGCEGFFGRWVTKMLGQDPAFEVRDYTRGLDVTKPDDVRHLVELVKPEVIINCVGVTGNANCRKDPSRAWLVNVYGVANLVRYCLSSKALLVQPSSVVVFDGMQATSYREDDLPNPQKGNIYAETKLAAEVIVRSSGVQFIIPRIATGYGPVNVKDTTNLLKTVLHDLEEKGEGKYFTDQRTNPVEILEVALAIGTLIKNDFRGIIHLGGPETVSISDFASLVAEEFQVSGKITPVSLEGTTYPPNMTLHTSLAQSWGISFSGVRKGVHRCKEEL